MMYDVHLCLLLVTLLLVTLVPACITEVTSYFLWSGGAEVTSSLSSGIGVSQDRVKVGVEVEVDRWKKPIANRLILDDGLQAS